MAAATPPRPTVLKAGQMAEVSWVGRKQTPRKLQGERRYIYFACYLTLLTVFQEVRTRHSSTGYNQTIDRCVRCPAKGCFREVIDGRLGSYHIRMQNPR
jgi:hypothetical protein